MFENETQLVKDDELHRGQRLPPATSARQEHHRVEECGHRQRQENCRHLLVSQLQVRPVQPRGGPAADGKSPDVFLHRPEA